MADRGAVSGESGDARPGAPDPAPGSRWLVPDSGPVVARLVHSALGLVFVVAFASLLAQLGPLFGAHGLSPIAEAVARARPGGLAATPTIFGWWHADAALFAAASLGLLAGALALAGVWARASLALATLLYLSFVSVGAPFLSFQWDLLLVECGALATLLPRDRASPVAHTLLLFLLFKLYFESGLVKWYSPLGDWHDGSAMSHYYETAPLPGPLAWYAHHLPGWWHVLESRATLVLELLVPLLVFCGRHGRRVALVALSGFQAVNLATANYGFFVYLALVLHLVLLGDGDLLRVYARAPGRRVWGRTLLPRAVGALRLPRLRAAALGVAAAIYLGLSLVAARVELGGTTNRTMIALRRHSEPLALFNVYHLFQQITRVRIEPEFAGLVDGTWVTYDLPYKPGPPGRRPPVVAPHQPRLDFQLWFHGLMARRPPPDYVRRLLELLCQDRGRVQPLFATPLAEQPSQVRVRYWRYTFTRPGEPGWWRQEPAAPERVVVCRSAAE